MFDRCDHLGNSLLENQKICRRSHNKQKKKLVR